jgi:hypothetical protein
LKIRTLDHLADRLAFELAWRKKELSVLLSIVRDSKAKPGKAEALLRSGLTVLYAHWEGFIRASASSYVEFVARRGLKYRNLKVSFRALAARPLLSAATESSRIEKMIDAVSFLLEQQEERSQIPFKDAIRTRSNLNSRVLKEIVTVLDLDYGPYVTKEKLIDHSLLHFRNNIAHGKGLCPSLEQVEGLYSEIIALMDLFKNQVENAAATEAYRMASAA